MFLRALGAKIGRGAWIDSYWFPEADLCEVRCHGAGCVVQTHLFQDRVMSLDTVTLGAGATMSTLRGAAGSAAGQRHVGRSGVAGDAR